MKRYPCILCGSLWWTPIPVERPRGVGVCGVCGFCHVRDRRSAQEIIADWGKIYSDGGYDPENWPAVTARFEYVAKWLDVEYGLEGKTLLDIGAGQGQFIDRVRRYNVTATGLEPSTAAEGRADIVRGSVEDDPILDPADFCTVLWVLENSHDPIKVLDFARRRCKPDGRVIVATGSRILVPFKKPLHTYLGDNSPDLHCFRWSRNTLAAAFAKAGLAVDRVNPYMECDWLVMSAVPSDTARAHFPFDPPTAVADFFRDWQRMWP